MNQGSLFSGGNAYGEPIPAPAQRHSATSQEAASEITKTLNDLQARLLEYFKTCGDAGSTDEEATLALDWNPSTLRPRRVELHKAGLIRDTGLTRHTQSGRRATVWILHAWRKGQ